MPKRRIAFGVLVAAIAAAAALCGCTQNLFGEFADKTSDEALLYDAQTRMDARDWTGAIQSFQKMSSTGLATRSTAALYSSAYAGRCGLDVIALASSLKNASSSTTLFGTLLNAFKGANVSQPADCAQALSLLGGISAHASGRTVDENLLAAFVALADIGVRLAAYADASPSDGTVDAGWDSCASSPFGAPQAPPGAPSDASARQIGVDFNVLVESLSVPGMPTVIGSVQTSLKTICAGMALAFPTYATCDATGPYNLDPTAWTQLQVSAIEGLIRTNAQPGLGIVNKPLGPAAGGGAFCL